jgi:hypothetical protein
MGPFLRPDGARRDLFLEVAADIQITARRDLPDEPAGDLLQADPILVRGGVATVDGDDPEGFSRGASQLDSDMTAELHPRCALGISDDELLVACGDGRRSRVDAGRFLDELARVLTTSRHPSRDRS